MAEMWRLFIAITIPPDVLDSLVAVQDRLKHKTPPRTVRWVRPEGIHLTLKFLGDVPVIKRETLEKTLAKAAQDHAPFTLAATGLGVFPNLKRPRVVWIGIQQDRAALAALRDAVEEHIAPLGYPTENRPFNPHLTLGRILRDARRADIQRFAELIAHRDLTDRFTWQVNDVHLIRSELKPTGAVYTTLYDAPLKRTAT
jgi:2'-5' RNA ligase